MVSESDRMLVIDRQAAGLCAVATMAMPSAVHAQDTGDLGPRLEPACLRIPNLEIRTNNLIERLDGDATVRGSLLWLQAQVDKAEAAGREQVVTVLESCARRCGRTRSTSRS